MRIINCQNLPGVDKPGGASKRGRKTKLKHKGGGSESERKQKDAEAGLPSLSGQTGSKAASLHTGKVSASAARPPPSSGPDGARSHAVKSLQGSSKTSAPRRSETSSRGSEEGNKGSTLVQSRLAWKTMANPAPPVDALKVSCTICVTVLLSGCHLSPPPSVSLIASVFTLSCCAFPRLYPKILNAEKRACVKDAELKIMPSTLLKLPQRPKGSANTQAGQCPPPALIEFSALTGARANAALLFPSLIRSDEEEEEEEAEDGFV